MLQICKRDRVAYSVGAPSCPECGHTEFWLQGQEPTVHAAVDVPAAEEPAGLTETEKEADKQAAAARAAKSKER